MEFERVSGEITSISQMIILQHRKILEQIVLSTLLSRWKKIIACGKDYINFNSFIDEPKFCKYFLNFLFWSLSFWIEFRFINTQYVPFFSNYLLTSINNYKYIDTLWHVWLNFTSLFLHWFMIWPEKYNSFILHFIFILLPLIVIKHHIKTLESRGCT